MLRGNLKWYNIGKRFGFIVPEDGSGDVFFHGSAVIEISSMQRIVEATRNNVPVLLGYKLDTSKERPCANYVTAL